MTSRPDHPAPDPSAPDPVSSDPSEPRASVPDAAAEPLALVRELVPGAELRIVGRLDVGSVGRVREALHDAIAHGTGDLLVRLDEVEVVDAGGLGVLVGAHRRARLAGRRLVLAGVPARLERLIRHTRLHRVLLRADVAVAGGVATG